MNIKILDSHLREYLKTSAKPGEIKDVLSLTSVSVERLEKIQNDYIYDIEITTNRVDLMSVLGIAKEASTALSQFGKTAKFAAPTFIKPVAADLEKINIKNNSKIVNRICAVIMSVKIGKSPEFIKNRLEASGVRSLNNLVDITNYVMKEIGHPAHVFDFDRLTTKTIVVREASKGERIKTLDGKEHVLPGGDIVADDGEGNIVDLLGIMGLENSVVTDNTQRILFFVDNNKSERIRKTSMTLGIRSEAAVLNEKDVDPQKAFDALLRGIELYQEIAEGKILSPIYDIYPNKVGMNRVDVNPNNISKLIGVPIAENEIKNTLTKLGFQVSEKNGKLQVLVPSERSQDVQMEEDIVEEVARIHGFHSLPSILPTANSTKPSQAVDQFYWEEKVKTAFKYWGFTETYTYSMVSEELFDGDTEGAVKIQNPLSEDFVYMKRSLVPSLLEVINENKSNEEFRIFEIANVYIKRANDLPNEIMTLAGVIKKEGLSFYEVKGVIEQLLTDMGINGIFKHSKKSQGASIYIEKDYIGELEILDSNLINFELNFDELIKHAKSTKKYKPIAKYPPVVEDLAFVLTKDASTSDLINDIKSQSALISDVSLLDEYQDSKTFHVIYQDPGKNLTTKEVYIIRNKIISSLKEKFGVQAK